MKGCTITKHYGGILNCNEDAFSHETFAPVFEISGGKIEAVGEQLCAIQNKNKDVGAVVIKGGNISTAGNGSQIFDNQGYMQVSKDVVVQAKETDKFLVSVDFNEGGTVTLRTEMVAADQVIEFAVTPQTGYKVESVMFDGVSRLAPYKLEVAGKSHFVEVTFVEVSSGNNSSGGGSGSGGSSSGRSAAKTAVSVIPETPGSWLQTEAGWQYLNAGGIAYVSTWIDKAEKWYWIESNGFMAEGGKNKKSMVLSDTDFWRNEDWLGYSRWHMVLLRNR